MLLGLQRRFHPMVLDGSKTHSIRAYRKGTRQWKVGDRVDVYGDSRQKTMFLLGRWTCTRVEEITIYAEGEVFIEGEKLSPDEKDLLAWRDGFRLDEAPENPTGCFKLMLRWWRWTHRRTLGKDGQWNGTIIHWDYDSGSELMTGSPKPANLPNVPLLQGGTEKRVHV